MSYNYGSMTRFVHILRITAPDSLVVAMIDHDRSLTVQASVSGQGDCSLKFDL